MLDEVEATQLRGNIYITIITIMCIEMKTKNITIREDQAEWIHENSLNLSRFVQRKLDELMNKNAPRTGEI